MQVSPTHTGDELFDRAAEFVAEIYNAPIAGEIFGIPRTLDGTVVSPDGEEIAEPVVAIGALHALLCRAYGAGRADQINDMYGTNEKRTVKARDLGRTLRTGNAFTEQEPRADVQGALEAITSLRGIFNDQGVSLDFGGSSKTGVERFRELIDSGQLQIRADVIRYSDRNKILEGGRDG